jgi:HlyD family secretion protein
MTQKSPRRFVLPALAVAGIVYGVGFSSFSGPSAVATTESPVKPATSQFSSSISASGLIEANTRNISIGSHLSGIVREVLVTENQLVKAGDPLFKLDDRSATSDLHTAQNELTMVTAQLEESKVNLEDQTDQLQRVEGLKEGVAVTIDRVNRLRFAKRAAAAKLEVTQANLETARARLDAAQTTLDKLTVTAPIDGRVFKINVRPGEFVQAGQNTLTPIVMGNDTPLHVRVTIDENDIWRFHETAQATAALRSNSKVTFPLKFVRVEPYVVPKTSLTGSTSERVDTRVLEVVYSITSDKIPVYIGQQVDVFVDASSAKSTSKK